MAISRKENKILLQLLATLKPMYYNLVPDYNIPPPLPPLRSRALSWGLWSPHGMFRDYAAMAGLQSPVEKRYLDVYWTKPGILDELEAQIREAFFPLFLLTLTSEGKVLSWGLPGLAEVCLHDNTVLKSGTKW
jgi:hypothetical protein